jgi:glucokinase
MAKAIVTLGIDIGGTNTKFGLVDKSGKVITHDTLPTNSMYPAEDLFKRLFEKFNSEYEIRKDKYELAGIGIGAPNANYYRGTVESPPNLNWGVVDLKSLVGKYYDLPVAVTNDANAAALGEMMFGTAKGMKNFIQITLGTGLGSGIVVDGNLLYGYSGFAGEMGHVTAVRDGRKCGCGRRGCLETYVSATGLKRTLHELLADSNEPSVLREKSFKEIDSKVIYEAAMTGDKIAQNAFKFTGKILGEAMADAVAFFSPEAIILFGGLANAGDLLLNPVNKHFENHLLSFHKGKIKILSSGLPEGYAAILGASALIWHELGN